MSVEFVFGSSNSGYQDKIELGSDGTRDCQQIVCVKLATAKSYRAKKEVGFRFRVGQMTCIGDRSRQGLSRIWVLHL